LSLEEKLAVNADTLSRYLSLNSNPENVHIRQQKNLQQSN